jgi:hypothetical protein
MCISIRVSGPFPGQSRFYALPLLLAEYSLQVRDQSLTVHGKTVSHELTLLHKTLFGAANNDHQFFSLFFAFNLDDLLNLSHESSLESDLSNSSVTAVLPGAGTKDANQDSCD